MAERVAAEKEQEQEQAAADPSRPSSVPTNSSKPTVEIQYCTQCRWLLRAAYVRVFLTRPSLFSSSLGPFVSPFRAPI